MYQHVLFLRHRARSTGLFQLQHHLDRATYSCITRDLQASLHPEDDLITLLQDLDLNHVVLVAHGIDTGLLKRVLARVPGRIAGLFLIGLAPSQAIAPQPTPTMILTSSHTPEITARLYAEQIQTGLPNSECVPIDGDSLLTPEIDSSQIAEVMHAFCALRIPQPTQ